MGCRCNERGAALREAGAAVAARDYVVATDRIVFTVRSVVEDLVDALTKRETDRAAR